MSGNITMALTFTPDPKLPEIHRCIIGLVVDSLNEYCITEEPVELDEALRLLRVLRLYVEPNPLPTG